MSDITLSSAVRSNLLSLQNTANLLSKTQEKLATGLKVNSAVDDPSAFFTASSLNARAGDLSRILDSVGNAIQTVKAADEGISAITKLVESAQASARSALQSAKPDNAQVEGSGASISADANASVTGSGNFDQNDLLGSFTGASEGTSENFVGSDLSGTVDLSGGQVSFDLTIDGDTQTITTTLTNASHATADVVDNLNSEIQTAFSDATLNLVSESGGSIVVSGPNDSSDINIGAWAGGAGNGSELGLDSPTNNAAVAGANNTLDITVGTTTATFRIGTQHGESNTLTDLVNAINADTNIKDSVKASNEGGNLKIEGLDGDVDFEIGGSVDEDDLGITKTTFNASNLISQGAVQGGDSLEIQIGNNQKTTITFGADDANGEVDTLEELNTALANVAGGTASLDSDGNLSVEADTYGDDIVIGGSGSAVELSGQPGSFGVSAATTTEAQSSTRTTLQGQFNDLLTQIDQLAADSSFNGVNLLDGDSLEVIFNEDGTSKLDINGVTFDSAGLGVSAVTGDSFQDNANINATLDSLDSALTSLRTQSTVFGSQLSTVEIRQDFTKGLSNVLETGAANLTLADTNEEGANLLALQTRQQLSSTALSLASQADQNVLRLF